MFFKIASSSYFCFFIILSVHAAENGKQFVVTDKQITEIVKRITNKDNYSTYIKLGLFCTAGFCSWKLWQKYGWATDRHVDRNLKKPVSEKLKKSFAEINISAENQIAWLHQEGITIQEIIDGQTANVNSLLNKLNTGHETNKGNLATNIMKAKNLQTVFDNLSKHTIRTLKDGNVRLQLQGEEFVDFLTETIASKQKMKEGLATENDQFNQLAGRFGNVQLLQQNNQQALDTLDKIIQQWSLHDYNLDDYNKTLQVLERLENKDEANVLKQKIAETCKELTALMCRVSKLTEQSEEDVQQSENLIKNIAEIATIDEETRNLLMSNKIELPDRSKQKKRRSNLKQLQN